MDQLHRHKAKSGFEFPVTAFDPGEFVHQWQARASKVLHAQERIAQGMAAAARAQLRYNQEYMVNHMNMLHWDVVDAEHLSVQARKDIENFAALVKEISGEIRSGFAEAGELLEIKAALKPQEATAEPAAKAPEQTADQPAQEATAEPVAKAPEQTAAQSAQEAAAEPEAEAPKQMVAQPAQEAAAPPAEAAAKAPKPAPAKAAQVKRVTRRVNTRS